MSFIANVLGGSDPLVSLMNMCPVLSAPVDWKETPEAHIFIADLPGLKKEDIKVEVEEGRLLKISGERKVEDGGDDKNDRWHRVERVRGKFSRSFKLPEDAKTDEIKASIENGVLTLIIPKQEVKKPQLKGIEIQGN